MDLKKENNNNITSSGFSAGQEQALIELERWLNSEDLVFTLSGYAGTGKTYLIKYFLKVVASHLRSTVSAPTHKAVRVIEKFVGKKGQTVHKLLGLRPNTDLHTFSLNNIQYDMLGEPKICDWNIVVIDEASMINKDLDSYLRSRSRMYNTRLLYLGDPAQLPPVGFRASPIFVNERKFVLTEIIRQESDNPLLKLLNVLRKDIERGTQDFIKYLNNYPKNINDNNFGYITLNKDDYFSLLVNMFKSKSILIDSDFLRHGAWSNTAVINWNTSVRNQIVSDPNKILNINDLLTGYNTVLDYNQATTIINSNDYLVTDILERDSDYGFKVFDIALKDIFDKKIVNVMIVDHTDISYNIFLSKLKNFHLEALYAPSRDGIRRKKWSNYFNYKNNYLSLVDIKLTDNNNKQIATVKRDLDYGYGLTIHKLQGSTFNNIFLNLKDVNRSVHIRDKNQSYVDGVIFRNKLVYTALSRASDKAIILT